MNELEIYQQLVDLYKRRNEIDELISKLSGKGGKAVPAKAVKAATTGKPASSHMSDEGRARIAEAQRKRWARVRKEKKAAEKAAEEKKQVRKQKKSAKTQPEETPAS